MKPLETPVRRRTVLAGSAAAAGLAAFGIGTASRASAAVDGHGLHIVGGGAAIPGRLEYHHLQTANLNQIASVNVLVPYSYYQSSKRYPVIYLLHGGDANFTWWDMVGGINGSLGGQEAIIVMPDGGRAGWYCNPVQSAVGPRKWETFHMEQLIPWIEQNYRTYTDYDGRAVAGFSMGGFGALKYAAKYYGHFCAVTCLSGPANIFLNGVKEWMQTSSTVDLGVPFGLYGTPENTDLMNADNPIGRLDSYWNKRLAFYSGTTPLTTNWWDIQEWTVHNSHMQFRDALNARGIPHIFREHPGSHGAFVLENMRDELPQIIGRMRRAG